MLSVSLTGGMQELIVDAHGVAHSFCLIRMVLRTKIHGLTGLDLVCVRHTG